MSNLSPEDFRRLHARVVPPDETPQIILPKTPRLVLPTAAPDATAVKGFRFAIHRFNSIETDMQSDYLIKGLLPTAGLAVVWGPPKCGKSFWVLDMLMHVALGRDYRDLRVRQGSVIYCALEGQKGFRRRLHAFRQERLGDGDTDPAFYLMESPLNLVADAPLLIAEIRGQIGDAKPDVICIDTLNRSIQG
jgi:RecA-family ATPase